MGNYWRCFVAVPLPEDLREGVRDLISTLRDEIPAVRWVKAENLHLTLKFLGDVEPGRIPELEHLLEEAATAHRPMALTFRGVSVFPARGRPRVLWVSLTEGEEELCALQGDFEGALTPLGLPAEGRRYTPHLTIGRFRGRQDPAVLERAIAPLAAAEPGTCVVERVQLMRSELFPTGPRYSILREVRLT